MRRPALLFTVALGCSFDASGFGEPPATSQGTSSPETGTVSTTGESSGGVGPTTGGTGGTGSGSLSGSSSGELTTEPGTATMATTGEATTDGTTTTTETTDTSATTAAASTTGEPCETMMVFVDGDGDGHGDPNQPTEVCVGVTDGVAAVGDDCNDAEPKAHPGLTETCDGIDNDCDTIADEYDAASNKDKCGPCTFRIRDKRLYYFCTTKTGWDSARSFCTARKLDLVVDSDKPEHDWLVDRTDDFGGWGEMWWIGGREDSGFKWVDMSAVPDDDRWAAGEPDDQSLPLDFGADCMGLVAPGPSWGEKWHDWKCGADRSFICEGAEP